MFIPSLFLYGGNYSENFYNLESYEVEQIIIMIHIHVTSNEFVVLLENLYDYYEAEDQT